jgi:hypothetical protein
MNGLTFGALLAIPLSPLLRAGAACAIAVLTDPITDWNPEGGDQP